MLPWAGYCILTTFLDPMVGGWSHFHDHALLNNIRIKSVGILMSDDY